MKTLSDLEERGYDPLAFRYFFLQAHYRQQQVFTEESMEAAARGHSRLVALAAEVRQVEGEGDSAAQAPFRQQVRAAMADDLNAPQAVAVLWDVLRSKTLSKFDQRDLLLAFDEVLGLDLAHAEPKSERFESDPRIDALLEEREAARARKDFAEADRIRDALASEGIELIDTPEGPRWRRG